MKHEVTPHDAMLTMVSLDGDIDADVADVLRQIDKDVTTKRLVLDCTKVRKINSIGIKGWLEGLGYLVIEHDISFVHCQQAFLDMAMMVPNFTRGRPILSFFAIWGCEECRRDNILLIEVADGQARLPNGLVCNKCGGQLLPDEDLQEDLNFVLEGA